MNLLAEGEVQAAQRMLNGRASEETTASEAGTIGEELWKASRRRNVRFNMPTIQPRSFADWLLARGKFRIELDSRANQRLLYTAFGNFVVRRGSVEGVLTPTSPGMVISYAPRHTDPEVALKAIRKKLRPDSPTTIVAYLDNLFIVGRSEGDFDQVIDLLQRIDRKPVAKADPSGFIVK